MGVQYEVECKYPVTDLSEIRRRLSDLKAEFGGTVLQTDTYFAHPSRDLAARDEALRIRRSDQIHVLTYKGPKIDETTKTRREIELPLPSDAQQIAAWRTLLEVLGFRVVGEVVKRRQDVWIPWKGEAISAALDEVDGLGAYVELEIVAPETGIDRAKALLSELAERLGLSVPERRSYLELLLIDSA